MAVLNPSEGSATVRQNHGGLKRYLPFLDWLVHYRRSDLTGDMMAGVIVAIMLVPQGMAYALLAGLPPQTGLYASILPLFIYGLLGSSRVLAVGPVAIVSLLVASGIAPLANGDMALYVALAITLAFLVGIIQIGMGLFRVGFLVNFLSHPVLVGFTAAAAIIIGFSQVKHVLGFSVPRFEHFYRADRLHHHPSQRDQSGHAGHRCFQHLDTALLQIPWRSPLQADGPAGWPGRAALQERPAADRGPLHAAGAVVQPE